MGAATADPAPQSNSKYYDQSPLFGYNSDTSKNRPSQRSKREDTGEAPFQQEESKQLKRTKTPRSLNDEEEDIFERRASLDDTFN